VPSKSARNIDLQAEVLGDELVALLAYEEPLLSHS